MARVFITASPEPEPEEIDDGIPVASVPWMGEYYYLRPGLVALQQATGEFIDPQKDAFFFGPTLDALHQFVGDWKPRASAQPERWDQRSGVEHPSGKPAYMPASRVAVLAFLSELEAAIQQAREAGKGLFFYGE